MSNLGVVGIIAFALLILFGVAKQSNECERNGGVLMKTLYSTYECVYKR